MLTTIADPSGACAEYSGAVGPARTVIVSARLTNRRIIGYSGRVAAPLAATGDPPRGLAAQLSKAKHTHAANINLKWRITVVLLYWRYRPDRLVPLPPSAHHTGPL